MALRADELLIKARANLIMESPFFGALALKLRFKEDKTCETGWTDGRSIGYNPTWVEAMGIGKVKGFIAHEVYHNALGHPFRRQERDPRGWNIACDLVLNARLRKCGFELPDDGLFDDSKADMTPEQVYAELPKEEKDGSKPGTDPGKCGECRGDESETGDKPRSESENKQLEHEWKQNVAEAAAIARMSGKLPADLERFVDKLFEPQIDWREVLTLKIDPNGKDDYSWSKRNRRFADIYLPSIRSEQIGEVVIIMDTSGSMWGGDDLSYAKTELKAIFDMCHPRVIHVIHVDAAVHAHDKFTPDDFNLDFKPVGGGGTSFVPGFEYIEKERIVPEIIIYFTDMYGDFPKHSYGHDVMWVDTCGQWQGEVPFGQHYKLRLEE